MTDDAKLLRDYAKHGSEAAFGELVSRYVDLVYSTALRQVNGDTQLAQDVTQNVFIDLARRAGVLPNGVVLGGWLYRHTGFTASKVVRSEQRRRIREQEAVNMNALHTQPNTDAAWRQVAPVLDEAMQRLGGRDRDAIVLRYFERRDLRAVGAALGTNEDAAQKRVSRALEKLRAFLARRGITFSAAVLATTIASQAVSAAPAGLAVSITGVALAGVAASGGITVTLLKLISMAKTKTAMAIVVAIATIIVLRWPNSAREKTPDLPQINSVDVQPGSTMQSRPYVRRNSPTENSPKMPEAIKVRLMFHVVDAETGEGLANTKIDAVYFYAGGRPERHHLVSDETGSAAIPEPSETNDQGMNVFVTAEGHVPKCVSFTKKNIVQALKNDSGNFGPDYHLNSNGEKASEDKLVEVDQPWHNPEQNQKSPVPNSDTRIVLPSEYTMQLEPALSVGGRVVDEQGQPVARVTIRVQGSDQYIHGAENRNFQKSAVTSDVNGHWLYSYIPKDYEEIRFILTREDYATTLPVVQVGKTDLTNLVLVINRGFTITGRIADPDGKPINGAEVKELYDPYYGRQSTKSGVDGFFILKGLNEEGRMFGTGEVHVGVVVEAKGFAPQKLTVHLVEPTNLVNCVLVKGNIFRGRVVDEAGNPISKAVVTTDSDFRNGTTPRSAFEWQTSTDAEGRFEWDSAPAGEICFWFEADGYWVIRGLPLLADGSDHEIKLKRMAKEN